MPPDDPQHVAEHLYRSVLTELNEVRARQNRGLGLQEAHQKTLSEILGQITSLFEVVNREARRTDKIADIVTSHTTDITTLKLQLAGAESVVDDLKQRILVLEAKP
jgi:septal ring factor EnvC (AmiA/AmiB activator)